MCWVLTCPAEPNMPTRGSFATRQTLNGLDHVALSDDLNVFSNARIFTHPPHPPHTYTMPFYLTLSLRGTND